MSIHFVRTDGQKGEQLWCPDCKAAIDFNDTQAHNDYHNFVRLMVRLYGPDEEG